MKPSFAFVISGLCFFSSCSLESAKRDDRLTRERDSLVAMEYSDKAWKFSKLNKLDSSFYYANKALSLGEENDFHLIVAYSLSDIGNYYKWREDYSLAISHLKESLNIRTKYGDTSDVISGYNNLALAYTLREEFDSAADCFQHGLELAQLSGKTTLGGILLNGLGTTRLNQGALLEAISLFQRSIDIALTDADSVALSKRYQNMATAYFDLSRYDEANRYFSLARDIYSNLGDSVGLADLLINEGVMLLRHGRNELAITNLETAERISKKSGFKDNLPRTYLALGTAYHSQKKFIAANTYYSLALEQARKANRPNLIIGASLQLSQLQLDAGNLERLITSLQNVREEIEHYGQRQFLSEYYMQLSQCYAYLGRYEDAYNTRLKFGQIRDSLARLIDNAQALAARGERTRLERNFLVKDNELKQAEILRQKSESEKKTFALITLAVFFLAVVIILLMRTRSMKIKALALEDKKKNDEQLLSVLAGIDQHLLERQLQASEQTTISIGKDLHDNFGSKLAAIQMSLEGIRSKMGALDKVVSTKLDEIDRELDNLCEDTRTLSHSLMDKKLQDRDLVGELSQFFELIDGVRDMRVYFVPMDVPEVIDSEVQKEIISAIRTLIENVLRHASASEVIVQVRAEDDILSVSIEDNGSGFDLAKAESSGGRGLDNARQRILSLGGSFQLETGIGNGTSIMFYLPIQKEP